MIVFLIAFIIITWCVCMPVVNIWIYEEYREKQSDMTNGQKGVLCTFGCLPLINFLYTMYWLALKCYDNRKKIFGSLTLSNIIDSFKVLKL